MVLSRRHAAALAGGCLGALEFALDPQRDGLRAALAVSTGASLVLLFVIVGGALLRFKRSDLVAGVVAFALAVPSLHVLTSGRRASAFPFRTAAVITGALVLGAGVFLLIRAFSRRAAPSRALGVSFAVISVVALFADAFVLVRLYPVFHLWLAASSLASAALAAAFLSSARSPRWTALWVVVPILVMGALHGQVARRGHDVDALPISGKVARWVEPRERVSQAPRGPAEVVAPDLSRPGFELRGDILLITVDALRYDAVNGDTPTAPFVARLAGTGVNFKRAYTTTPSTSYALGSLFCGTHLLSAMDAREGDRETLTDSLSAMYQSAAFFPPAVFSVDGARFASLAERSFGFAEREIDYASAEGRAEQLERFLARASSDRPVFAWVHLLEPHEPYDGDPDLSDEARYGLEVGAADRAIERMAAAFETRRGVAPTLVVTSDHGEEFGEHGGAYHGTTLYDEQVRVPLVITSPDLEPRAVEAPVDLADIAPTLLAAAGVAIPMRMTGDDLGLALLGGEGPEVAIIEREGERATVRAGDKVICRASGACRVFDLSRDPREVSGARNRPREREALQDVSNHLARVAARENPSDGAEESVFARARLGDRAVAAEVVRLLSSPRSRTRAEAARGCGELGLTRSAPILRGLLDDASEEVRLEVALALASLGEHVSDGVVDRFARAGDLRAVLAAARAGRVPNPGALIALAENDSAPDVDRHVGILALGTAKVSAAREPLQDLLRDPTHRVAAAEALGALGDVEAGAAVLQALSREVYPAAREAEVAALGALQYRPAIRALRLALEEVPPVPGSLEALWKIGPRQLLLPVSARRHRRGSFTCGDNGCLPGDAAALWLGPETEPARVALLVNGPVGAIVQIGEERFTLERETQQLVFEGARRVDVASEDVRLLTFVVTR